MQSRHIENSRIETTVGRLTLLPNNVIAHITLVLFCITAVVISRQVVEGGGLFALCMMLYQTHTPTLYAYVHIF